MNEFIEKVPYILSASMTFITGIIGLVSGMEKTFIYNAMLIILVVFLVIGLALRAVLQSIVSIEEEVIKENVDTLQDDTQIIGSRIDIKVNEDTTDNAIHSFYEEEFSPLKVSQIIRTKGNTNKN